MFYLFFIIFSFHLQKIIFFLGCGDEPDTCAWIIWSSNIAKRNGKEVSVISWVHSHVRGIAVSFSSIDVHTQYVYNKTFPGILGLVFQIGLQGECQTYDFFSLTGIGTAVVGRCSETKNMARHLHEECNNNLYYHSQKRAVTLIQNLPWNETNFFKVVINEPNQPQVYSSRANEPTRSWASIVSNSKTWC